MSMPKPENEKKRLLLTVVYPDRPAEKLFCDAVTITIMDNEKGRGGGLYGIRPGHAPALFALECGKAEARSDGSTVFARTLGAGYAKAADNVVTIVTESGAGD